jgi:hypothetical protein
MSLLRIPRRFYEDHDERALPTPAVVKFTKTHIWIDADDAALDELRSDAEHYAHRYGPDQCPPGLIPAARALLAALDKRTS